MKTPRHLSEILGMISAANLLIPLGAHLKKLDMLDAEVELFEFLGREGLNPDTMEVMEGLCEEDLHYIIHTAVICEAKYDRPRTV